MFQLLWWRRISPGLGLVAVVPLRVRLAETAVMEVTVVDVAMAVIVVPLRAVVVLTVEAVVIVLRSTSADLGIVLLEVAPAVVAAAVPIRNVEAAGIPMRRRPPMRRNRRTTTRCRGSRRRCDRY